MIDRQRNVDTGLLLFYLVLILYFGIMAWVSIS